MFTIIVDAFTDDDVDIFTVRDDDSNFGIHGCIIYNERFNSLIGDGNFSRLVRNLNMFIIFSFSLLSLQPLFVDEDDDNLLLLLLINDLDFNAYEPTKKTVNLVLDTEL
ncbi:hypothetical protein DERP_007116, partial [Dermatophagoides pteronyssinus]